MHHVLRQDMSYWNNSNLQTCFIDCLTNLWIGLEKGLISDIFFPEVSLNFCLLLFTVQFSV